MSKILKLLYGILLLPFALIFVVFVRLISPLIVIRWHAMISTRIGHFAENTNVYLCEKKLGYHKLKKKIVLDLFYFYPSVCNNQLAKMWKRKLIIFPYFFMHVVNFINENIANRIYRTVIHDLGYYRDDTDLKKHQDIIVTDLRHGQNINLVVPPLTSVDRFNSQEKSKINISFTKKEINKGEIVLKKFGINPNKKIIGIILRDETYLQKRYPNISWEHHQIRQSPYNYYEDCAKKLIDLGYIVVVFGAQEKDFITNNTYINYSNSILKSDFMDIYLNSKLHFAVSSANGLDAIPIIFNKPIVEVAVAPIESLRTYCKRIKILFKTYYSKTLQRKLSLKEIYEFNINSLQGGDLSDEIEFIHPTSEEITSAALEMHKELQNNFKYSEEEEILQKKFKDIHRSFTINTWRDVEHFTSSIGTLFLKNNKNLLDK